LDAEPSVGGAGEPTFLRPGTGKGAWEADVYVFALEDTLVSSRKGVEEFTSRDKRFEIRGKVVLDRIKGLLSRMKQPFYVISEAPSKSASDTLTSMGAKFSEFGVESPRLYAGRDSPEEKVEALKRINARTVAGIQLSYVDTDAASVQAVLATPELASWKVYWANWAGGQAPEEFKEMNRSKGQVLEVGTFVELVDFGMILGYHDWGV